MSSLFAPLPNKKYQIIYADPPWKYYNYVFEKGIGKKRSACDHYPTVDIEDLKKLPVKDITDKNSCLLFLWTTSPLLKSAISLIEAWGFKYATVAFIWHKKRHHPGHYNLTRCELVLVAKKGKIPQPRGIRNAEQFLFEERREHSRKPTEIRRRINSMFPTQSKIELFAREQFDGWDVWGNQVPVNNNIPDNETCSPQDYQKQPHLKSISSPVLLKNYTKNLTHWMRPLNN